MNVLSARSDGLGGAVIRMRAGPDRDILMRAIKGRFPSMVKITPNVDDLHLFGGVNLAGTLATGVLQHQAGILDNAQVLCLTMAERCSAALAARLGTYLDTHPSAVLLAFDEGADGDETLPSSLSERLAFQLSPEGHAPNGFDLGAGALGPIPEPNQDAIATLTHSAAVFGITSLRPPTMALRVSGILAALNGAETVDETYLSEAAALVFAQRATRLPEDAADTDATDQPETSAQDESETGPSESLPQGDLVVEAIKALLPAHILAGLGAMNTGAAGQGAGQTRIGNRRGRPLPARSGRLDGRRRLDLLPTLRAAAPWQPLRRKRWPDRAMRSHILLLPQDFRVKRYEIRSDRLIVFAVDASGSAAISRLNEAKGAIELLLGEAYAARDHVALVSFRDQGAECLLTPTRSLVQTKRKLAALPGGGGTPLAAGLQETLAIAEQGRRRGMSPIAVLVTDGKTNIALDGTANRSNAREDATRMATQLRRSGLKTLVVDIAARPQPQLRDLSQHLDARYIPLPRADAHRLTAAVSSVLDHG